MKAYSVTDVGQRRKINQDYVFASAKAVGNLPNLFIVADGMGGHNAGDFASKCAVSAVIEYIEQSQEQNPIKLIREAVQLANARLLEEASKQMELAGMGTTMVVTTICGHYAYTANVGDSRLYLIADDEIRQITKDHSLVEEMVRLGQITKEEARCHPDKNIITRAIGASKQVDVDFFDYKLEPDSVLLMCSDGLSNMVEENEILRIVIGDGSIGERAQTLINTANDHGGRDNIAVILIEPDTNEVE